MDAIVLLAFKVAGDPSTTTDLRRLGNKCRIVLASDFHAYHHGVLITLTLLVLILPLVAARRLPTKVNCSGSYQSFKQK